MQLIPAMDLRQSRCVRLTQGEYERETLYSTNPVEVATRFWDEGARHLHCVDLEGARSGRFTETGLLRAILARHDFAISAGGGLRSLATARELLELGVRRLVIGTLAIRSPETIAEWIKELGPDHFAIGLDLKNGELATDGWTRSNEASLESLVHTYGALGVRLFLCTDISRDGTLNGPNLSLYHDLRTRYPAVDWIASGGIGSIEDLKSLAQSGVTRAIAGKALYEGKFTYGEAVRALAELEADGAPERIASSNTALSREESPC